MFAGQLLSQSIAQLQLSDKVSTALQNMADLHVAHLPVESEGKYVGLIAEEDLLDAEPTALLESQYEKFLKFFVKANDHFLLAVKIAKDQQLSVVPVVSDEFELQGVLGEEELFRQLAQFTGAEEFGGLVVLEMERKDYSAGELNRLVESNDAFITQLNTSTDAANQTLIVTIRINKSEISDILATFQRHEFIVRYFHGEELYRNELQSNLDHLLNYLNI